MKAVAAAVLTTIAPIVARSVVQRLAPQDAAVSREAVERQALEAQKIAAVLAEDRAIRAIAEDAAKAVAKPWWTSKGVWGALGVVVVSIGGLAGAVVTTGDIEAVVQNMDKIVTGALGLYALFGRIVAQTTVR